MRAGDPDFRTGNLLTTRFTGTLSERHGTMVERIPAPRRLIDWLTVNGLTVDACTDAHLDLAWNLREAIHAAVTAAALDESLPGPALQTINDHSAIGQATAYLTSEGGLRWRLNPTSDLMDALGVIAADAISLISGQRHGRLALCASPTCRAVYLDTSQSRTRRWCDMNTCGNRQKKARYLATKQQATPSSTGAVS